MPHAPCPLLRSNSVSLPVSINGCWGCISGKNRIVGRYAAVVSQAVYFSPVGFCILCVVVAGGRSAVTGTASFAYTQLVVTYGSSNGTMGVSSSQDALIH